MESNNLKKKSDMIIAGLLSLKEDRGAMSALRGGLSETLEHKSWPIINQWCDISNDRIRTIVQTVSALFATHPIHAQEGNFGQSLRIFVLSKNPEDIGGAIDSFTRHINRLCACDDSLDLCKRLPFYIRMLKSNAIPVDYAALYTDILFWSKRVKLSWVRGYYQRKETTDVPDKNSNK